jgi:hypothetical protein
VLEGQEGFANCTFYEWLAWELVLVNLEAMKLPNNLDLVGFWIFTILYYSQTLGQVVI